MKKVLISGGSRGIGAACVEKFRSEGDRVVFLYRSSDDAARSLCEMSGAECLRCDVSDPAQAVSAF
ncbi:MAG: SDR family NAD(P)-dependent oxidoreductase, partial [Candidatus Avispirillum sp.]